MTDTQPIPPAGQTAAPVPAPAATPPVEPQKPARVLGDFKDEDLVYVDPDTRKVVGFVEFSRNDKPKSLAYAPSDEAIVKRGGKPGSDDAKRFRWRKFFPWGTYKSMRRIYRLDGKPKDAEPNRTLEEVLPKALKDAYWND